MLSRTWIRRLLIPELSRPHDLPASAAHLSRHHRAGLASSPGRTHRRVGIRHGVSGDDQPALFPFDKFRNIDKMGHVRCPVLMMHGEADEIVPLWHGQRLFQAAPEPKRLLIMPGAHHNDLLEVAGERYAQALREFEALLRGR